MEKRDGRIKTVDKVFENNANNRLNFYKLAVSDFDFTKYEDNDINPNRTVSKDGNSVTIKNLAFLDSITKKNGGTGTIMNLFNTETTFTKYKNNSDDYNEVEISIKASQENSNSGLNQIQINLADLGYETGDIGWLTFDYYTKKENLNGEAYQIKHVYLDKGVNYLDIFTDEPNGNISIPLTESTSDIAVWESFDFKLKINDDSQDMKISIGHGGSTNNCYNSNSIIIRKLRLVKLCELPKYYLETENNYKERVLNFWDDFTYDVDTFTIPAYNNSENETLSFISLPFKYSIKTLPLAKSNNNNMYNMGYTSLGGVCFSKTNSEIDTYCSAIEMLFDVNNKGKLFLKQDYDYIEGNWDYYVYILNESANEDYIFNSNGNLRNFDITDDGVECVATIALPSCDEKDFLLKNLTCNPYGYHFELPVDAKYDDSDNNKPMEVAIPLYTNGEVRLIMKNAVYNTDLPTVFCEINYSES